MFRGLDGDTKELIPVLEVNGLCVDLLATLRICEDIAFRGKFEESASIYARLTKAA